MSELALAILAAIAVILGAITIAQAVMLRSLMRVQESARGMIRANEVMSRTLVDAVRPLRSDVDRAVGRADDHERRIMDLELLIKGAT